MRETFKLVEIYRVRGHHYAPSKTGDKHGYFQIKYKGNIIRVIATNGDYKASNLGIEYNWEHVSVSLRHRTPNWEEMCHIKYLFWDDEETVIQFHPPKSQYVNYHPYCLHLWKPNNYNIILPPMDTVGPTT